VTTEAPIEKLAVTIPEATRFGFVERIRELLEEGAKHHGGKFVQDLLRILTMPAKPPTKKQMRQMRDQRVLQRLLAMKPAPQPYKLARLLAKQNKTLPKADRWGTGTTITRAMEKYIERLWKAHKARQPSPPPAGAKVSIFTSPP
jgi:hypothetical protein